MPKIISKVTAKGLRDGIETILQCVKYNDDENLKFLKDGYEDIFTQMLFIEHIGKKYLDNTEKGNHLWLPDENSIEAYWAAFHETYFDELPEIVVEGELDTFGSPYSDEDTSDVVF